ncbi:hypothetical protein C8R45DRAFT_1100838 [Mycena sanguinolenta]|nr:hypothetical protein C8R45DRAFT_1100838 [Mycena sanguinolenta]
MSPLALVYTVFRRRSYVFLLVLFFLGQFMREMGIDAQHSTVTRIAFKYAGAGVVRAEETIMHTRTLWATRTLTRAAAPVPTRESNSRVKKLKANAKGNKVEFDAGKGQRTRTPHLATLWPPTRQPPRPHPIPTLISRAESAWALMLASATTTLHAAAHR